MAFRMGFKDHGMLGRISPADLPFVSQTIPYKPMITEDEFALIRKYYSKNAPDFLFFDPGEAMDSIKQFKAYPAPFQIPFITLLKFDSLNQSLYIGNRSSKLYKLTSSLQVVDSIQLESPPTHASFKEDQLFISLVGILLPNDQSKGKLISLDGKMDHISTILDSLKRFVFFEAEDLNQDGQDDFIACAFGHYSGALKVFESKNNSYIEHTLNPLPGARKVIVKDFNNDGRKDIVTLMTQGDEKIILYTNQGKMAFEEKVLLRFPPVFGSSYFDFVDFNNDGHLDILYTNGDNGDFSMIVKPYHGVRIFTNDGENNFKETWSFSMPGASEARAYDFDKDGDLDIAAISYFPDFINNPERSFIYFENRGNNSFIPQTTRKASTGRWLVIEIVDIDNDDDADILLGSLSVKGIGATAALYSQWLKSRTSVLVLENNFKLPEH